MDDFLKANQSYNASLTTDYTVGDNTLGVNTIPSNVPTLITVGRDTDYETRFTVTGTGVNQLTGVTRFDGENVNIPAGVSVECIIDEQFINQLESAVFNQSGLKGLLYAADGGASDSYAITLPVVPDAYTDITGLPIAFKANTANTGAATLNVNSLGAKTIKKFNDQDLVTGDIESGQVVLVAYDGTNFQMLSSVSFGGDFNLTTGGNIQVNSTDPKRGFYVDASAMKSPTTSGAASGSTETTTNKVYFDTKDFDSGTDEYVQFRLPSPDYWDAGTITAKFYWTAASSSGDVIWGIQGLALANDDALDTAWGTAQTVTDTLTATGDMCVTSSTSAMTLANTPTAGDYILFRVYRDADAGGDTLGADAKLIGVSIKFTIGKYDDQ